MYARNMRALKEGVQHRLYPVSKNQIRGAESTTIESESGVVPPVATVTDPLTEESDQSPSIDWDDDEELPPFIPAQSSDDDDTVTIVACAAAAAVAAILAVFLVIDRKG